MTLRCSKPENNSHGTLFLEWSQLQSYTVIIYLWQCLLSNTCFLNTKHHPLLWRATAAQLIKQESSQKVRTGWNTGEWEVTTLGASSCADFKHNFLIFFLITPGLQCMQHQDRRGDLLAAMPACRCWLWELPHSSSRGWEFLWQSAVLQPFSHERKTLPVSQT